MSTVKTGFASVAEYIAAQPSGIQPLLRKVQAAIRNGAPAAEEIISYKMPTYKIGNGLVLHFAGWKHHISLYPASDSILETFKVELGPYEIDNRTIRFPIDKPMPTALIERIAELRAAELQ